jgi:hypothetical protein
MARQVKMQREIARKINALGIGEVVGWEDRGSHLAVRVRRTSDGTTAIFPLSGSTLEARGVANAIGLVKGWLLGRRQVVQQRVH